MNTDSHKSTTEKTTTTELVRSEARLTKPKRLIPRESVTAMDQVLADALRGKASLSYLRTCVGACMGAAVSLPVLMLFALVTNFLTPPITGLLIALFTTLGAVSLEYRNRSRVISPAENVDLGRAKEAYALTLVGIEQAELSPTEAKHQRQLALDRFTQRVDGLLFNEKDTPK